MIHPENIVPTHGASGANHHIFYSMINPGDRIISIMPAYQQLYSIPESYKANVQVMHLEQRNGYLPDLDELRQLATPETKMICINNPNNPTGALISNDMLREIVEIAKGVDAYVLCDEVYRHLTQEDIWCESVADIYEKGISVSSMSKVFSMAGLRLGWIATHDMDIVRSCLSHRDYTLISCGMFDEAIAGIALEHNIPQGTYFVMLNIQKFLDLPQFEGYTDLEFCEWMIREIGVAAVPGSSLFREDVNHLIRLHFAREKNTLDEALCRLERLKKLLG